VELVHESETQEIAEKITKACKIKGAFNVQLRKTDKGFIPFEVNARISSTVYFRHLFGFQDVKWWLDISRNKPVEYKLKYLKGIGVRMLGEVLFNCDDV